MLEKWQTDPDLVLEKWQTDPDLVLEKWQTDPDLVLENVIAALQGGDYAPTQSTGTSGHMEVLPLPPRLTSDGRLPDRHNLYRTAFRCLIQADIALPEFSVEAPVVNHGPTVENAVAQELTTHGYNLYYFNSKKRGEMDFVIEDADGRVMPIEVKSGKD